MSQKIEDIKMSARNETFVDVENSRPKKKGVQLSFHNLSYEVDERLDSKPVCGKKGKKEILHSVSGVVPPGLNAIMGPTGSGKTSLLDVLAKRKDPRGLREGVVLVDGKPVGDNFRLLSGYVVQDDVVMGTLSVRENLAFSANLRLSSKEYSNEAKREKVDNVIDQLGLTECANTFVGNEFVRGVSGGERKRVNIGMEMILDPPVLFLDEPTTGLDANTANSLILLLYKLVMSADNFDDVIVVTSRLALDGRNIIMSIHQPRYSIFSMFDRLILLTKGDIAYIGSCQKCVSYFEEIGYKCPDFHNPADFFLDVIGGDVNTARLIEQMNVTKTSSGKEISKAMESDEKSDLTKELIETFKKSEIWKDEQLQIEKTWKQSQMIEARVEQVDEYANGFFKQLGALSKRTILNILRNPITSVVQIMVMIIFGVLIGLIYFQSDTSFKSGIQNRAGCFFFLITSQVMSNLSALEIFIRNRKFFRHESASGYYRASVYFVAQVFADLIPNRVIPNCFFSILIYFMIGFQMDAGKFFIFLMTLVLTAISASSVAFFVSASVNVFAVANVLVSLPYIFMMMFGGFLANIDSILNWLEWIKWFSIFRYGINSLTVNEMSGLVFFDNPQADGFDGKTCINSTSFARIANCTTGEEYMERQGIPYGDWGLWQNILALGTISLGFLMLAYIQLRRINKYK